MAFLTSFRIVILTLICFFMNIPYGIDAPDSSTFLGSSLDNGAVVCEQSDEGYTATFSVSYRQEYRNFVANGDYYEVKVFVMQPDDVITPHSDPGAFLTHREYIDDEEGHPALKNVKYTCSVEGGSLLIKDGSEFTLNVTVTLPPDTPAGAYSITAALNHYWETVFRDVLIVP